MYGSGILGVKDSWRTDSRFAGPERSSWTTLPAMQTTQPRILIVDADRDATVALAGELHAQGLVVGAVAELTQAAPAAARFGASLILLATEVMTEAGLAALRATRTDPRTAHLPVAIVAAVPTAAAVLEALRAGAADVFARPLDASMDLPDLQRLLELPRVPGTPFDLPLAYRLTGALGRLGLTVDLIVPANAAAKARFEAGQLVEASAGGKKDREALELLLKDPTLQVRGEGQAKARPPSHPSLTAKVPPIDVLASAASSEPGSAGRCLLVDDEPHLLKLFTAFLSRVGFEVSTAADGVQGFDTCLVLRPAVVVADLNMPRLDGWGLLRKIRSDHRIAETPLVFLSAQDDYRESLRAVGAGAQDYLAKVSKMDLLARRIREVLVPRERVAEAMSSGGGAHGRVEQLGVRWLLSRVAQAKRTGVVACADGLGVYNVGMQDGNATFAGAQVGTRRFSGEAALALVAQVRTGDLQFLPGPVPSTKNLDGPLPMLLERAANEANEQEQKAIENLMVKAVLIDVDGPLFALYERFCGPAAKEVAGLIRAGRTPKQVIVESQISPLEVEDVVRDMIRRKVISPRAPGT